MTPFGIAVWQQPMPEQDPSTTSLILEHRDMHPVVYAVPLEPFIKAYIYVTTNGRELVSSVEDGEFGQMDRRERHAIHPKAICVPHLYCSYAKTLRERLQGMRKSSFMEHPAFVPNG